MHIVMQLLKSTVVHFGASCMPLCSSRSCLVPPAQHHLQQPRSTATTAASESSTVVTPKAPAASAAHDWLPPCERGPSWSATFKQQRPSDYYYYYYYYYY